jgi:hypothetical protein
MSQPMLSNEESSPCPNAPTYVFFDPLEEGPGRTPILADIAQACIEAGRNQCVDLTKEPWPFAHSSVPSTVQAKLKRVKLFPSRETNILAAIDEVSSDEFLIHIANVPNNQSELLAITLVDVSSYQFFCSFPLSSSPKWLRAHTSFPRWSLVFKDLASFYPAELSSRDQIASLFAGVGEMNGWLIDTTAVSHLGHYILSDLGPSLDCLSLVSDAKSESVEVYRRGNVFLPPDAERVIFSSVADVDHYLSPLPTGASRAEMKRYAERVNKGIISIFGCRVSRKLERCLKNSLLCNHDFPAVLKDSAALFNHSIAIGVGVRGGGRQLVNLDEILSELDRLLASAGYGNRVYVLDGMAKVLQVGKDRSENVLSLDQDLLVAKQIAQRLTGQGAHALIVAGLPLLDQLKLLEKCNAIIGHIGSSSAKYSWLLGAPTVVHGMLNTRRLPKPHHHCVAVGFDFQVAYRGQDSPVELCLPKSMFQPVQSLLKGSANDQRPQQASYRGDVSLVSGALYAFIELAIQCSSG